MIVFEPWKNFDEYVKWIEAEFVFHPNIDINSFNELIRKDKIFNVKIENNTSDDMYIVAAFCEYYNITYDNIRCKNFSGYKLAEIKKKILRKEMLKYL